MIFDGNDGGKLRNRIAVIGLYGMSALFHMSHLPKTGETVKSRALTFEPGGKGYNQAISASRMGGNVYFATAVGDDEYGYNAAKQVKADGISECDCVPLHGKTTAFASVCIDDAGNNIVIVNQGACESAGPAMIEAIEARIADCDVLLLQCEMPLEIIDRALETAKKSGAYTILNPAPARDLSDELFGKVDLLTPNWGEALQLCHLANAAPAKPVDVCKMLQHKGCGNVTITMGERGAHVLLADGSDYHQQPFRVNCVDTTGAGDTFNGTAAAMLAMGKDIRDSIMIATAASALSVTRQGVMDAIPSAAEVYSFIQASFR